MSYREDMKSARLFIDTGTGTLKDRLRVEDCLCMHLRDDRKVSLEDGHAIVVLVEALRKDSYQRGLTETDRTTPAHRLQLRGKPINPMPGTQREKFEFLITAITGCSVGDGTLTVTQTGGKYVNEHVQYMWEMFQQKTKGSQ